MPTSAFQDCLSILLRAFYRLDVRGLENLDKAGPNAIIALNHVSFLDGAVALSILDKEPVFAVDHEFAQRWWVRPILRLTRAMPLDPARPLATRKLIQAVRGGDTLVIFPEGQIYERNDQLLAFHTGVAQIGFWALDDLRKAGRELLLPMVPIAVKYRCLTSPDRAIELGYGHPMGPLKLTDHVGLDVRLAIAEHLLSELGERFRPPQILRRMVRSGLREPAV